MNPVALERQRLASLSHANAVRARRSAAKQHLANGSVTLAQLLHSDKDFIEEMRLRDPVMAVPKVGGWKADRAFFALDLSPTVRVANVPMEQRAALLAWFKSHCPRVEVDHHQELDAGGVG